MKKITLLLTLFAFAFSFEGFAQYGCASAVVVTDGYTASAITSPGNAGPEDWNDNPTVECGGTSSFYWDDDVYVFTYTAGATDEEISMSIFSRSSWNGIGIFSTCSGTVLDGCLDTAGATGADTAKTVTANVASGQTVYIAVGQWGTPNNLDFDVTAFSVTPLVNPPSCTTLSSPLDTATDASLNGDISWNAASGAATDYLLEVGTSSGGTEVFSGQVGNVTTYNVGALVESTIYYVTITPSNSNGVASGCLEETFTTLTPLAGDFFSNPLEIVPSEEGVVCATASSPFQFDFTSGYTDSGLDDTCTTTNTGLDIFFSWTATSDALIWNDGGGDPGIAVRDAATGAIIDCVTTFAAVDYVLSGWAIGDDLIFQVYDYGTASVNPLSFCLVQYNLPAVPECATNYVSTPDATCGGLNTTLSWDAAADTDGYFLSVGTTSGATDILDNVDIGNVTTYDVSNQTISTTYYWTLSPYNVSGPAESCSENTYTTIATNCYCVSVPTSNDGNGIASVQVGTTDFTSGGDLTYEDFTGTPVDLAAGISSNVQIVFETGYTYDTNIWIDFNDDFVFDVSEQVFDGVSLATNPTTFNASFVMPAAAALGTHRMRIGTADDGQGTPNPCYSGTYGVTVDLDVNIIEATCSAAAATATIVADCDNNQFFIDVDVTDLGDGTPVIDDGTNTFPVTALGVTQVGPYASGTTISLTITHGTDATCDTTLDNSTYSCPPANDECDNAVDLTVNEDLACGVVTPGTTVAASASPQPDDATGTPDNDVWFTFTATSDSHQVSLLNVTAVIGTSTDMGMSVFDDAAGCNMTATNEVGESDPNTLMLTGLTVGNTYYVRVYGWSSTNTAQASFDICVGTPPPPPANDACDNAFVITDFNNGDMQDATSATNNDGFIAETGCGSANDGVWYTFEVIDAGTINIDVTDVVGWDPEITVLSGDCNAFTCVTNADGGGTGGSESASFTATANTQYWVNIGYYSGFTDSSEGPFTINISTTNTATLGTSLSVDDFTKSALFTYYPNPVNDNLTLNAQKEISNVSVYNMVGQEVYRNAPNSINNSVDMSNLQSGAYFVKVTVDNVTETIKVIKN